MILPEMGGSSSEGRASCCARAEECRRHADGFQFKKCRYSFNDVVEDVGIEVIEMRGSN